VGTIVTAKVTSIAQRFAKVQIVIVNDRPSKVRWCGHLCLKILQPLISRHIKAAFLCCRLQVLVDVSALLQPQRRPVVESKTQNQSSSTVAPLRIVGMLGPCGSCCILLVFFYYWVGGCTAVDFSSIVATTSACSRVLFVLPIYVGIRISGG
jgi:hypothetical protein